MHEYRLAAQQGSPSKVCVADNEHRHAPPLVINLVPLRLRQQIRLGSASAPSPDIHESAGHRLQAQNLFHSWTFGRVYSSDKSLPPTGPRYFFLGFHELSILLGLDFNIRLTSYFTLLLYLNRFLG